MKFTLVAAVALAAITRAQDISCALPCVQDGIKQVAPKCPSDDFKCACPRSQDILNAIKPCLKTSCGEIPDAKIQEVISQYC
ncbi:hypothetical protein BDV33DRAFT_184288 [Aspergillus novoparasiticus]|uniref:CFEM domain-containing protein n=1 Tax=Aspergillus novoparasiticus TaxID=986946 RepID=A0A5N6E8H0_9EURO|nr:hypothetical protein BDV33DRAFT_184288 [Aspergillus novoparasiticus]